MKVVFFQSCAFNLLRILCAEKYLELELYKKSVDLYQRSQIVFLAHKYVDEETKKYTYKFDLQDSAKGKESLIFTAEIVRETQMWSILDPIRCGLEMLANVLYKGCNPTKEKTHPLDPSNSIKHTHALYRSKSMRRTHRLYPSNSIEQTQPLASSNSIYAEKQEEKKPGPRLLSLSGGVMYAILKACSVAEKSNMMLTLSMGKSNVPSLVISSDSLGSNKNFPALPLHLGLVDGFGHTYAFGNMVAGIELQSSEDKEKAEKASEQEKKKVNEVAYEQKHTNIRQHNKPEIPEEETEAKEMALEAKETEYHQESHTPTAPTSPTSPINKLYKVDMRPRVKFDFGILVTEVPEAFYEHFTKPLREAKIRRSRIFECDRVPRDKMPTIYMNIQTDNEVKEAKYELTSYEYIIQLPGMWGQPDNCVFGIVKGETKTAWVIGATFLKRYSVRMRHEIHGRVEFEIADKNPESTTQDGASSSGIKVKTSPKTGSPSKKPRF